MDGEDKGEKHRGVTHLRYYRGEDGRRVYTLQKIDPTGLPTFNAHSPRFDPHDDYARQRVELKMRHGLLDERKIVQETKDLWIRLGSDPALMGEDGKNLSLKELNAIRDKSWAKVLEARRLRAQGNNPTRVATADAQAVL